MRDATLLVVAGLAILAMACAPSSPPPASAPEPAGSAVPAAGGAAPRAADPQDGAEAVGRSVRASLVEVDAPDLPGRFLVSVSNRSLAEYRSMILEPVRISYPAGARRFRDLDHDLLARQFARELKAAIAAGPAWKPVTKPGPDTLRVRVTLAEVMVDPLLGGPGGSAVTFADDSGGAILAFDLLDSTTGLVLHRYMERRVLPGGMYSGGHVDRRRLASLFSEFAKGVEALLRREVDASATRDASTTKGRPARAGRP